MKLYGQYRLKFPFSHLEYVCMMYYMCMCVCRYGPGLSTIFLAWAPLDKVYANFVPSSSHTHCIDTHTMYHCTVFEYKAMHAQHTQPSVV